MKISLVRLIILLAGAGSAFAQIAFVNGTSAFHSGGTVTLTPAAVTAGNGIVITVCSSAQTPTFCKDNNGNPLFSGPQQQTTGVPLFSQQFYGIAVSGATQYICSENTANAFSATLDQYSGVLGFNAGLSGSIGSATGTSLSQSVTTEDSNDWVNGSECGNAQATTASGPNTRQTEATQPKMTSVDTGAITNPGSATITGTFGSSTTYNWNMTELKTAAPAVQTWTLKQFIASRGTNGLNADCKGATTSNTCTFSISPAGVTAGSVLAFGLTINFDGTDVQQTLTSIFDCTGAGPCNAGNTLNTWTLCGAAGQGFQPTASHSGSTDCAYVLNANGGATTITITYTSTSSSNTVGGVVAEFAPKSGFTAVRDDLQTSSNASANSVTMVGTTVTGTDAILQLIYSGTAPTVYTTAPYNSNCTWALGHFIYCAAINQVSGSAPTDTVIGSPGPWAGTGLAFKAIASPGSGDSLNGILTGTWN